MTMDIAVNVRLVDNLTRQSREIQATFNRLTASVTKLATAGKELNIVARGIGAINRAATANNGAVSNIARMTQAIHSLSSRHTEIMSAAQSMTAMARSIRALNDVSNRAIGAANGIRQIGMAMSHVSGGNAFGGVNTQLREMNSLLRQAHAGMRRLGGGGAGFVGGGGGPGRGHGGGFGVGSAFKHALVFGGTYAAVEGAKEAIGTTISRAMSEEDALATLRIQGADTETRRRYLAKAQAMQQSIKGTTVVDNLNALLDARTAMGPGRDDDVISSANEIGKLRSVLAFTSHKDIDSEDVQKQVFAALKTTEIRGMINDPKRLHAYIDSLYRTSFMSHGRVGLPLSGDPGALLV